MANEVRIIITADDRSQAQLDQLARRLKGVENQGENTTRSFDKLGRGGLRAFQAIERGYGILTRLDLVQITVQQSAERVSQAQENYTAAVARFGPASQQALQAQQELNAAQQAAEKVNLRAKLSYVLVVGDIAALAVQAPRAIQGLRGMAVAFRAATAEATAFQIATGGILIAAGALAAILIGKGVFDSYSAGAKGATGVTEQLAAAQEDLAEKQQAFYNDPLGGPVLGIIDKINNAIDLPSEGSGGIFGGLFESSGEQVDRAIQKVDQLTAAEKEARASYAESQRFRAVVASGTEEQVRNELDQTRQRVEDLDLLLRTPNLAGREAVQAEFDSETEKAEQLVGALVRIEQAGLNMAQSLNAGLRDVGVNLENMTAMAQRDLMLRVGVDPDAVNAIVGAREAEEALAGEALRASKSLREQASITKDKGETTEEFRKRLIDAGFTEEELAGRIDETTGNLISQEEATRRAHQAAGDAAPAYDALGNAISGAGNAAARSSGRGGGDSYSGAGYYETYNRSGGRGVEGQGAFTPFARGGYADMAAEAMAGQSSIFKGTPGAARLNENQDISNATGNVNRNVRIGANAPNVIDAYREELQILLSQNPGARSNPAVAEYFNLLNNSRIPPGAMPRFGPAIERLRGKALPFLTAAMGFSGTIDKPTLLMVGEGGQAEDVDVRPRSQGGRRGGSGGLSIGGITVIIQGGNAAEIAPAVRRGVVQGANDVAAGLTGIRRGR